jgi:hypothetical protein
MLEEAILEEFEEKDYAIFEQQLLDLNLDLSEFQKFLNRIILSKSKSFQDKVSIILKDEKQNLLEEAFRRAKKRYKTKMALRFVAFEQDEVGE